MLPMTQLSVTAATAPPKAQHTHMHINTDTHSITQSHGLKHFQSLTRVTVHQLLPQSPSSSYQKALKWLGLSDGGLKQLSAFRAKSNTDSVSPFTPAVHMWSPHWKETQTLLGKHVCVSVCVCVVGNAPKKAVCELWPKYKTTWVRWLTLKQKKDKKTTHTALLKRPT